PDDKTALQEAVKARPALLPVTRPPLLRHSGAMLISAGCCRFEHVRFRTASSRRSLPTKGAPSGFRRRVAAHEIKYDGFRVVDRNDRRPRLLCPQRVPRRSGRARVKSGWFQKMR